MHNPLPIEIALWERFKKFQPSHDTGYRLPNRTRVLLEIDEAGNFTERDHVSGEIIDVGVLEGIEFQKRNKEDFPCALRLPSGDAA